MAFDIKQFVQGGFKNAPSTFEELKLAADQLANSDFSKSIQGIAGNNSLSSFGGEASSRINQFQKAFEAQKSQPGGVQDINKFLNTKQHSLFVGASPDSFGNLEKQRSGLQIEQSKARQAGNTARADQFQKSIDNINNKILQMSNTPLEVIQAQLRGDTRSFARDRFNQRFQSNLAETKNSIQNELSNIANMTDFSALAPDQVAKELQVLQNDPAFNGRIDALIKQMQTVGAVTGEDQSAQINKLTELKNKISMGTGDTLAGTSIAPAGTVKDAQGNFIPLNEATNAQKQPQITKNPDGTYSFGGQVFTNPNDAIMAQQRSLGQTPQLVNATPTPVDNTINASDFIKGEGAATVGGTPNLQTGTASPIFTGADGTSLFYIPPGSTQPVKISNPEQLQSLAQQGLIEVGGTRRPIGEVGAFLSSQTTGGASTTSPDNQGFLTSIGATAPTDQAGVPIQPTDAASLVGGAGTVTQLAQQQIEATNPFLKQIQELQSTILGFQPTDLTAFRQSLEKQNGLDSILNELGNVDQSIADLVGVERRVPATTLERARGTEITQGTLDRQRTIELQKLASASAPLTDLKKVLTSDLDRRTSLINEAVDLKKEGDAQRLKTLGTALDFAVTNNRMAQDQAETLFNAAVTDFENGLDRADAAAKIARDQANVERQLMIDFYDAQGYVINPETGQLAETLQRQKFLASMLGSSGSGGGGSSSSSSGGTSLGFSKGVIQEVDNILYGNKPLVSTSTAKGLQADTFSALRMISEIKPGKLSANNAFSQFGGDARNRAGAALNDFNIQKVGAAARASSSSSDNGGFELLFPER